MALDNNLKQQLSQYLALLEQDVVFKVSLDDSENSKKLMEFVDEIVKMSPKLSLEEESLKLTPSFKLTRKDKDFNITFAGIPLGHEFNSFVLALLQVSGRAPKISEEDKNRIESISQKCDFTTYVSLSCHNCPDVVQSLNILSVLNENISHTMVDGSMYRKLVEEKDIMAVPTVYLNGEEFAGGRMDLNDILSKLDQPVDFSYLNEHEVFDVLVVGGGPAAASAAIYAARKGIKTGLVAKKYGGQVVDTLGIENIIGTKYTEGPKFMDNVKDHMADYPIEIIDNMEVLKLERVENLVEVHLKDDIILKSKTVIVATGARWRDIGVKGESEFKKKGVAYCPHCDGPLFKGKDLAVVGGGNSGIEAAIDLAGIVNHVTVLEFLPELKADKVLQDRLFSLKNVDVKTNVQTTEITGDTKVNGITFKDRETNEETHLDLSGVFVQIGLIPNTEWLKGTLDLTPRGEIIVDKQGATSLEGVFACGDCTDSAYKQIIISMGSGATAALGAFDYLIRN